jgi:hypothetical protein
MITDVTVSRESLIIGAAAFLVCFGLLVWLLRRRQGDRVTGPALLAGLPGIYLASLPPIADAPKWLYIPGLLLVALSYLIQVVLQRRQQANSNAGPPDTDSPV